MTIQLMMNFCGVIQFSNYIVSRNDIEREVTGWEYVHTSIIFSKTCVTMN